MNIPTRDDTQHPPDSPLERRIAELETRLAFQDDMIDQLNGVITRQDEEIRLIRRQLEVTLQETRQLTDQLTPDTVNEPPPHY